MTKSDDIRTNTRGATSLETLPERTIIDPLGENGLIMRALGKRDILADPRGDLIHGIVECPASGT